MTENRLSYTELTVEFPVLGIVAYIRLVSIGIVRFDQMLRTWAREAETEQDVLYRLLQYTKGASSKPMFEAALYSTTDTLRDNCDFAVFAYEGQGQGHVYRHIRDKALASEFPEYLQEI